MNFGQFALFLVAFRHPKTFLTVVLVMGFCFFHAMHKSWVQMRQEAKIVIPMGIYEDQRTITYRNSGTPCFPSKTMKMIVNKDGFTFPIVIIKERSQTPLFEKYGMNITRHDTYQWSYTPQSFRMHEELHEANSTVPVCTYEHVFTLLQRAPVDENASTEDVKL